MIDPLSVTPPYVMVMYGCIPWGILGGVFLGRLFLYLMGSGFSISGGTLFISLFSHLRWIYYVVRWAQHGSWTVAMGRAGRVQSARGA